MRILNIRLKINILRAYIFLLLAIISAEAYSQRIINHDYPRIATIHRAAGNIDWLSRYDFIFGIDIDTLTLRAVKQVNPNNYILTTTDWNAGGPFRIWGNNDAIPAAWRLRHSDGTYIKVYGTDYFVDPTDYCGLSNGERYNQALPRRLMDQTDWSIFDGVSSDGTWPFPYNNGGDIDLDRNGVNDYTEHGYDWIRATWQAGQNAIRSNLRAKFKIEWGNANEKLLFYWTITDTMCINVSNGGAWENMYQNSPTTFSSWIPLINQWETIGVSPRIHVITADLVYDSAHAPARHKDYYRFVRWGLCTALLNDVYFMSGDITDHHWTNYYDEYDVILGYPKGKAQALNNGCRVRFFENGVSIVNPTNTTQTVTTGDLSGLSGYGGPYYRFRGNQDPVWNDGSLFTSATLISTPPSYPGRTQNVGDGIILVTKQTAVISDIIIDNAYTGTSPGSSSAKLTGFTWDQSAESNWDNPRWYTVTQYSRPNSDYYSSYYAPSGDGSSRAVFKPTINVTGKYKVYEWHGWCGKYTTSYSEASNVPCRITSDSGITNVTIDQTRNYGKWNLVGTFTLRAGRNDSVMITNKANGYVIADAFMFEYVGESSVLPSIPIQNSPPNGGINQPTTLNISWHPVIGTVKYHLQIALDSNFSNIILSDSSINDTLKMIDSLNNMTSYYWRVRTLIYSGWSSWSTVWSFRTINNYFVQGKILFDKNNNGVRIPEDITDAGITGWKIYLRGPVNDSMMTDKNGFYRFERLPKGYYEISESKLPGWTKVFPSWPIYGFTLDSSRNSTVCNYGYFAPNVAKSEIVNKWNLVSLPLVTASSKKNDIFPSSVSSAYEFKGSSFNVDNLEFGKGYWLKFSDAQTLWIPGSPVTLDTIDLLSGWNIIGNISDPTSVTSFIMVPDSIISSFIYGYDYGYILTDTLVPGKGYWLKTNQSGKLIMSSAGHGFNKISQDVGTVQRMNSVTFSTNNGENQKIFFTSDDRFKKQISNAQLPPKMPDIFDVRFEDDSDHGSLAAFINNRDPYQARPIIISSIMFPLSIRWQINDPTESYQLETNMNDRFNLRGNGEITLDGDGTASSNARIIFKLRTAGISPSSIPSYFDIQQNYPNPFNNSTSIALSVPENGRIRLEVFNVLGERVFTWLDEDINAGSTTLDFDAPELPSGVYFYKALFYTSSRAPHSIIKRMIILK